MENPADIARTAPRNGAGVVANVVKTTTVFDFSALGHSLAFTEFMLGKNCVPPVKTVFLGEGRSVEKKNLGGNCVNNRIHNLVNLVLSNLSMKVTVMPRTGGIEIKFWSAVRGAKKEEKLTPENYELLRKFIKDINPDRNSQHDLKKEHVEANALAWILECLRLDMGNNAIHVTMEPSKEDWIFNAQASAMQNEITWKVDVQSSNRCLRWFVRMGYIEVKESLCDVLIEESGGETSDENHKQAAQAMTKLSQILKGEVECDACDVWLQEHMPCVDRKNLEYFLQRMRSNFVPALEGEVEVQNVLDKIRLLIQTVVDTMNCEDPSAVVDWIFATLCNDNSLTESDVEDDSCEMETDDEDESSPSVSGDSEGHQPEARVTRRTSAVAVPAVQAVRPDLELQNMSPQDVKRFQLKMDSFIVKADRNGAKMGEAAKQDFFLAMMTRVLDFAVAHGFSVVVKDKLNNEFKNVDKHNKQPDDATKKIERVITQRLWMMLNLHGQNDFSIEIANMMQYLIQSFDNNNSNFLFKMTSFARLGLTREMEQNYNRKDFRKIDPQRVRNFLTEESVHRRIVGCFPTEDNLTEICENVKSFYTAEMIRMLVQFMITVKRNDVMIEVVNDLMKQEIEIELTQNGETRFRKRRLPSDNIPQSVEKWLLDLPDRVVSHKQFATILFARDETTRKKFSNELNLIALMKRIWWQLIGKDGPTHVVERLVRKEREIYLKEQEFPGNNILYYNRLLREYGLVEYSQEQARQVHAGWQLLVEPFVLTWRLPDDYNLTLLMSVVDDRTDNVDRSFKGKFDSGWLHEEHPEDNGSEVDMEEVSEDGSAHASDEESEAESSEEEESKLYNSDEEDLGED